MGNMYSTFKNSKPIYSLTVNTTISMKAMRTIWRGLVFPNRAPNEINTAAAAKSAVRRLKSTQDWEKMIILIIINKERKKRCGMQKENAT